MSAFGGVCSWDERPVSSGRLAALAAHSTVAGPDRQATVQPVPWLALQAHVLHFDRLSTTERQPHTFGQGSVLTWDGRLDNREDLLVSLHRALRDDESDAALVAAAYERWGVEALPRLVGDWSLAIWDAPQQRVVLARDYVGNRPLYYRAEPDRLVWATRLEALAACEHLFDAPDDLYIASFLTTGAPYDMTPFKGVSALLAGHVLIGTRNSTIVRRYWTYAPATLRYRTLDDYSDHLRMLLTEAVRVRLRANRPVWAHLSGGWDSSSVVCLAHRLIERGCVEASTLRPISQVYEDRESAAEHRFIAAVEQWCGLPTTTIPFQGRPTFAEMLGYQVPAVTFEGFGLDQPTQAAGDHIVLTGTLGDLLAAKGEALLALTEPLQEGRPFGCLRGFVAYARATRQSLAAVLIAATRKRFALSAPSTAAAESGHGISPDWLTRVRGLKQVTPPPVTDFPRTHQELVKTLYGVADLDAVAIHEMFAPVWRTHPFLHRPLIEFLLAVPRLAVFDPLFARAGMRRALADILPPAILERTSKVGIPPSSMRRTKQRYLERMISAPPLTDALVEWRLVQRGIVDLQTLAEEVRRMRADPRPSDFLDRCLNIEAWLRSLSTFVARTRVDSPVAVTMARDVPTQYKAAFSPVARLIADAADSL